MAIYIYNENELKGIEAACMFTASVLDELERNISEGITTYELDKIARDKIKKENGTPAFLGYRGFPGAVCASINEVVVHGIPGKNVSLKKGDIIGIDIGILLNGFYGDSARTFKVGNIDTGVQQLLDVTKESLYHGIQQCVEGNRISDISNAVQSHAERFGYSPVREFVGHGIGKNLHEEPSIPNFGKPGKGPRMKNGMVFAIEPMINMGTHKVEVLDDGWTAVTKDRKMSAHFEHTVAIIDGEAKILTKGINFS